MLSDTSELQLPRGLVAEASVWQRVRAEIIRFLPAWMFFAYACLLLNTGLTNFEPSKPELSANVCFTLAVFLGFYFVRAARAPDVENRWAMALVALAVAVAFPLLITAWHQPSPINGRGLLVAFELSTFVWAALMIWHARRANRGHVWLFFGVGFLYGLCLENGGIVLGFFHETNLELTMARPLVAPVATMVGWCIVLYISTFVVWQVRKWVPWLRRQHALSGLLVAVCATLLDFQGDPLATAASAWVWDASLPPWFYGVPLVNYVAWLCALTPFAWAMFRMQERLDIADGGVWNRAALTRMVVAVPGALAVAALLFMVSMGLLEGLDGPSWALLEAFATNALAAVAP